MVENETDNIDKYPEQTSKELDVAEEFGLKPSQFILDLGCGEGRHSVQLIGRGYKNVIGVDTEDYARSSQKIGNGYNFIQSDWNNLPFKNSSIDFAFSFAGYGFDAEKFQEVGKVLKPQGSLLFDVEMWDEIFKKHQSRGGDFVWDKVIEYEEEGGDVR